MRSLRFLQKRQQACVRHAGKWFGTNRSARPRWRLCIWLGVSGPAGDDERELVRCCWLSLRGEAIEDDDLRQFLGSSGLPEMSPLEIFERLTRRGCQGPKAVRIGVVGKAKALLLSAVGFPCAGERDRLLHCRDYGVGADYDGQNIATWDADARPVVRCRGAWRLLPNSGQARLSPGCCIGRRLR